jgi:hypothetical protein
MADIPQVLATYGALVGVALGAGLTYGFGALNRRHHEKRENDTRWYNARFQAYVDLHLAASSGLAWGTRLESSPEDYEELTVRLASALGVVRLVGSQEVITAAGRLVHTLLHQVATDARGVAARLEEQADRLEQGDNELPDVEHPRVDLDPTQELLYEFIIVARKDLGHP